INFSFNGSPSFLSFSFVITMQRIECVFSASFPLKPLLPLTSNPVPSLYVVADARNDQEKNNAGPKKFFSI
ncbi:MAG TPA: hypothetical protein PLA68_05295, partial [Panacibacter sp.]|nr:hypothetical protein [Panacibacter sp.]